jgi:rhamnose transport system permease protein
VTDLERPHVPPPSEPEARASHSIAELVLRFRELGIVLALIVVVAVTAIDNPNFVSSTSLQQLVAGAAIIGLLAIGETMVIVTRNVDLSVGSVLGLSAYAAGALRRPPGHLDLRRNPRRARDRPRLRNRQRGGREIARVPSLVVTLGTLYVIGDRCRLGRREPGRRSSPCRTASTRSATDVPGRALLGWIWPVAVAIATYWMRSFRTGRDLYAIGSNPTPPASQVSLSAAVCSSHSSSRAASPGSQVSSGLQFGSVDAIAGAGYEFQVIAAVVVGGVAQSSAAWHRALGAALGALLPEHDRQRARGW